MQLLDGYLCGRAAVPRRAETKHQGSINTFYPEFRQVVNPRGHLGLFLPASGHHQHICCKHTGQRQPWWLSALISGVGGRVVPLTCPDNETFWGEGVGGFFVPPILPPPRIQATQCSERPRRASCAQTYLHPTQKYHHTASSC